MCVTRQQRPEKTSLQHRTSPTVEPPAVAAAAAAAGAVAKGVKGAAQGGKAGGKGGASGGAGAYFSTGGLIDSMKKSPGPQEVPQKIRSLQ